MGSWMSLQGEAQPRGENEDHVHPFMNDKAVALGGEGTSPGSHGWRVADCLVPKLQTNAVTPASSAGPPRVCRSVWRPIWE